MDVNGTPFWQFRTAVDFGLSAPESSARDLEWCASRRSLTLADLDAAPQLEEDETRARQLADAPSVLADNHGGFAWWDDDAGRLIASGFSSGAQPVSDNLGAGGPDVAPTDLALGDDIILFLRSGKVSMFDLRERWPEHTLDHPDFQPALATASDGIAPWLLDRATHRLARLRGTPLPSVARSLGGAARFTDETDRSAPRIVVEDGLTVPDSLRPVALRVSAAGQLAILCWNNAADAVFMLLEDGQLRRSRPLAGLRFPTSFAWSGEDELCVLATDGSGMADRAFAYDRAQLLSGDGPLRPNGRFLPLIDHAGHGLANHAITGPRHIAIRNDPAPHRIIRRLAALSRAARSGTGSVMLGPIDGGQFDCVWHRLYLEAEIPPGCGMRIALYASNRIDPPAPPVDSDSRTDWALHLVGAAAAWPEPEADPQPQWPRAAWCHSASEIAGHGGFSPDGRKPDRAGLFTCLVQDGRRAVRRVKGRYLWVQLELTSNGRATPELFALRLYGNRFAYRDRYLPELYGETLAGEEARANGPASPPDFLERLIHLMEGPMSEMETRVANGWTLTDPSGVPDGGLDWLASWTGFDFAGESDVGRKRQKLIAAPHLARLGGTAAGLAAVLELETGGRLLRGGLSDPDRPVPRPGQLAHIEIDGQVQRALVLRVSDPRGGGQSEVLVGGDVSAGRIVAVEGFRLRRTLSTLLGVQLANPADPLLPGMSQSGNSVVGDSLILGEEDRAELLAHFSADLSASAEERQGLASFYRKLAHRVLVLVRRNEADAPTGDDARIANAARAAAPAHVAVDMVPMSAPFIAGVASLIGIDSFLSEPLAPQTMQVGSGRLTRNDRLWGRGSLDRRGDVPAGPPPVARADAPASANAMNSFMLDGSRSRAGRGRHINRYIWTWN